MIESLCRLLQGMLGSMIENNKTVDELEQVFVYCMLWALGGAFDDQRKVFSNLIKGLIKWKVPDTNLFELSYDPVRNEWISWHERVPSVGMISDVPFHQLMIPTMESTHIHSLIDKIDL